VSQKPSKRFNLLRSGGRVHRRSPVAIQSVHTRSQFLKLRHCLRLSGCCRAMHETTDEKGVGIWTDTKPGEHTYFLKITTLNSGNHATRTDGEAPDQSGSERQENAPPYRET